MNEYTAYLTRLGEQEGKQTKGHMMICDEELNVRYQCDTLELPWKNNERRVSCIPCGEYEVKAHTSPKFGKCFWIQGVPGRSEILIHSGNYYTQILGCILVGQGWGDVNKDGICDVLQSKSTMANLVRFDIKKIVIKTIA